MVDLATTYLGLKLRNPIVVGSCGLTRTVEGVVRCQEAGAGAVVLKSFFEEQFSKELEAADQGAWTFPEARDYLEKGGLLEYTTDDLSRLIEKAKAGTEIPVIASINCRTARLWPRFARQFENAGADAVELNIFFLPLDPKTAGLEYERLHFEIVKEVAAAVSIPVSVKLSPYLTSIPHLGQRLVEAGSRALVLFNWFMQPDIDVKRMNTRSAIGRGDFHLSLRWVGLCAGRLNCDIASSGGVRRSEDVVKLILAGAAAVQVASLFLREGIGKLGTLIQGLEAWMEEHGYASIADFQGEMSFKQQDLSHKEASAAEAYFRSQYLETFRESTEKSK
ncbi:MAG: dihydroorotate dehydrogenase-like protein [Candidatus Aminicenantes bacterium]|nr:dihydroorotate dehydrogenase-like protein [Candidatus Aminicenantes bacterium]